MKKRKIKKLLLSKATISNLEHRELEEIKGGKEPDSWGVCTAISYCTNCLDCWY
jgi:natural product precursor